MTTYLSLDKCKLLCSCKKPTALCRLYFCQHCLDVRCSNCVSHEVDSYYCPNCLENMACAEAKIRKNRCSNCFNCPSCGHTLSTRATATVVPAPPGESGKPAAQKVYYLACVFCRWTTRDSGIADQRQSSGGWQEPRNQYADRVNILIGAYRQLAVREKNERDLTRYTRRPQYQALLDRYPILNPRLNRRPLWSSPKTPKTETLISMPSAEPSATPKTDFNPEEYIDKPLALEKVTNVIQRLLAVQPQPQTVDKLQPQPKPLLVKQSMRCKKCEHSLSKADISPNSIKFRINRSAVYHVPDLRFVVKKPATVAEPTAMAGVATLTPVKTEWVLGQPQTIIISLSNPARRMTIVSLRQLTRQEESQLVDSVNSSPLSPEINPTVLPALDQAQPSSVRPDSAGDREDEAPKLDKESTTPTTTGVNDNLGYSTVELSLPKSTFKLAAHSDAAEFDNIATPGFDPSSEFKDDDPKLIAYRQANKLGIYASVFPSNCSLLDSTTTASAVLPLRAAVELSFDFKPTTSGLMLTETQQRLSAASDSARSGKAAPHQPDEPHTVKLVALLDFGELIVVKGK